MNKLLTSAFSLALTLSATAQTNRYAQPELRGDLMIDVGMTFLRGAPEELDIQNFNSRSVGIYYNRPIKISDRFTFNPGIGFTFEKLRFDHNLNFQTNDDNEIVFDVLENRGTLRTNKLAINYIELPIEMRYYPTRTVDGEGLFVSVGGMVGARIESHTKIKYTFNDVRRTEKLRDRFGLSDFRLGVQGRVGLRGLHLFYKHFFTDVFGSGNTPGGAEAEASIWIVGINVSGL